MFSAQNSQVASSAANYIEDVFSTYLYTGNGSTQTITNGIDLSGKGGMVWTKTRGGTENHWLYSTASAQGTGAGKGLMSNTADSITAYPTYNNLSSFNSDGFTLGTAASGNQSNPNGVTAVSWTFRKQAKFFDVVTYTGNGSNRTIAHSLGSVPGCIIIKRTDSAANWQVYHRSLANTEYLVLNATDAKATGTTRWNSTTPTSTEFSLGTDTTVNANSGTYVAYLFAHDAGGFGAAGTDNVITCGSFTGASGTGIFTVNLGYEPQWILTKSIDNAANNWGLRDTMRGFNVSDAQVLSANTSSAETNNSTAIQITNTGFAGSGAAFDNSTFIYIAIRRGPMKTPTSGTSVFTPVLATSSGNMTFVAGFPVDMWFHKDKSGTLGWRWWDRLRDDYYLDSATTGAENLFTAYFDSMTQSSIDAAGNYSSVIGYPMRRAPGFFDVVCYTGTGSNTTITHNLGATPELMIVKRRGTANAWAVYANNDNTDYLVLNTDAATVDDNTYWNDTSPTSSVFSVGTNNAVNASGSTYVAYLFASVTGVSKVGSYTGNGSNQTINCGFTAGARFVMIKRTDSTGDWYVYDTARGIVSGNDPQLKLNSTAAEATGYDAVDPDNSGFIVNNDATNFPINVNNATYIYLAIA